MNSSVKRKSVVRNTRRKVFIAKSVRRFSFRPILLFLALISFHASSQSVEYSLGFNRLDYQMGIAYAQRFDRLQIKPRFEVGISSSFAQKRLFPRISMGTSYLFISKETFEFGPELTYAYSRLKFTDLSVSAHHWNELNLGYTLEYGRSIRCVSSAGVGWLNEIWVSDLTGSVLKTNTIGYHVQIGVKYYW